MSQGARSESGQNTKKKSVGKDVQPERLLFKRRVGQTVCHSSSGTFCGRQNHGSKANNVFEELEAGWEFLVQ